MSTCSPDYCISKVESGYCVLDQITGMDEHLPAFAALCLVAERKLAEVGFDMRNGTFPADTDHRVHWFLGFMTERSSYRGSASR